MSTVHVVGYGIVGRRVQRMLTDTPLVVHDPRRPNVVAIEPGDVVVLALGGEHARLTTDLLVRRAHVVSIGDGLADTRAQLALDPLAREHGVTVVVGAALAPGLASLLARHLAGQMASADEIHVAVHGTAGPACARGHHTSLGRPALGWHDGGWIDYIGGSGRELCWFPEPIGARDCYHAEHTAPVLLQRAFADVRRISVKRSATRRDRLTARLPMLRPPHAEGGVGALRVEVRGAAADGSRVTVVAGVAELVGTAAAATAATFAAELSGAAAGRIEVGVVVPGEPRLPTLDLLHRAERYGVRLQLFTGIPTA